MQFKYLWWTYSLKHAQKSCSVCNFFADLSAIRNWKANRREKGWEDYISYNAYWITHNK